MVGRKSHLSPACKLFLYGETSGDKTFTEPDIFPVSTSQQRVYAMLKLYVVTCVGACRNFSMKMDKSELSSLCFCCFVVVVVANNHELSSCLIAVLEIKAFSSRFSRISQGTFVLR